MLDKENEGQKAYKSHRTINCQNVPLFAVGIHAITYEYTWWMDPKDQGVMIDAIDKMVGDYQFTCPVQEFAQRYADTFNDVSVNRNNYHLNYNYEL